MIYLPNLWLGILVIILINPAVENVCQQSITTASGRYAPKARKLCSGQVIFEENFESFKEDLWQHDVNMGGGGNGEFQWYTDSARNSLTRNGCLLIRPTLTTDEIPDLARCKIKLLKNCHHHCHRYCNVGFPAPPIQSALLRSRHGFSFKYGRLVIRAKLPSGDWLWPSIWMLPVVERYGEWPRSGEIRLLDGRGNVDLWHCGKHIGTEQMRSTLHFGTNEANSAWLSSHFMENVQRGEGLHREFHEYQLEWSPDEICFSLDHQITGCIATDVGFFKRGFFRGLNPWVNGSLNAPFDQEFYFVLNLAVGGTNGFFPDHPNKLSKPWSNLDPYPMREFWKRREQWLSTWDLRSTNSSFLIDFIRLYAL